MNTTNQQETGTETAASDYYDCISDGYNELHGEEQLKKLCLIKSSTAIKKNTSLLDVGCGTGISSDFNCFVVGADQSYNLLRQGSGLRVNSVGECLPFKDNSFDIVICVTALHNFNSIEQGLREMRRVGKGRFIISALKSSKNIDEIKRLLLKNFKIEKIAMEEKDIVFFLR